MRGVRFIFVLGATLLVAGHAWAMFRAADLVIVPAAAAVPGYGGAVWKTDVEILNVDTVPIDVEIVFLPSGGASNQTWFDTFTNHLGGRSEDGFTKVDAKLKDIAPGQTVTIEDIINANWGQTKGALLLFAFEAGSFKKTTPPGGNPKKIIVNTRTYTLVTAADNSTSTYGQQIPGLPWHDYIDPSLKAKGLDHVVFTGLRQDKAYRTAVGLLNISDKLTYLDVQLVLKAADGTELKNILIPRMNPLSHKQYDSAAQTLFFLPADKNLVGASLTVSVAAWHSSAANPVPALLAYVSRIDNTTNDPIYIEQTFDREFPWDCVFNGKCPAATVTELLAMLPRVRPLSPPTP